MFETLDEELGIDSEYRQTGNLILAASEAEMAEHRASVAEQRAAGLDTCILTPDEVYRLAPALSRRVPLAGARYCRTDGSCNPIAVTYGYANAARRLGARFLLHCPVTSILVRGGAAVGVQTPEGRIEAGRVILAAGPWSVPLAREVGVELPIVPHRHHVLVTEPIPPLMEPFGIHLSSGSWWRQALPGIGGYGVHAAKLRRAGVPILTGHTIVRAEGREQVEGAVIARVDERWQPLAGTERSLELDTICLAVGLSPLAELAWMAGCRFSYQPVLGGWVPLHDERLETTVPGLYVAGDVAGIEEASTAMEEGRLAGAAACASLGLLAPEAAGERLRELRQRLSMLRQGPFGERRAAAKACLEAEGAGR